MMLSRGVASFSCESERHTSQRPSLGKAASSALAPQPSIPQLGRH